MTTLVLSVRPAELTALVRAVATAAAGRGASAPWLRNVGLEASAGGITAVATDQRLLSVGTIPAALYGRGERVREKLSVPAGTLAKLVSLPYASRHDLTVTIGNGRLELRDNVGLDVKFGATRLGEISEFPSWEKLMADALANCSYSITVDRAALGAALESAVAAAATTFSGPDVPVWLAPSPSELFVYGLDHYPVANYRLSGPSKGEARTERVLVSSLLLDRALKHAKGSTVLVSVGSANRPLVVSTWLDNDEKLLVDHLVMPRIHNGQ